MILLDLRIKHLLPSLISSSTISNPKNPVDYPVRAQSDLPLCDYLTTIGQCVSTEDRVLPQLIDEINQLWRNAMMGRGAQGLGFVHDIGVAASFAREDLSYAFRVSIYVPLGDLAPSSRDLEKWAYDWIAAQPIQYQDELREWLINNLSTKAGNLDPLGFEPIGVMSVDQGYLIMHRLRNFIPAREGGVTMLSFSGDYWRAEEYVDESDDHEDDQVELLSEVQIFGYVDFDFNNWRPVESITKEMNSSYRFYAHMRDYGLIKTSGFLPIPGYTSELAMEYKHCINSREFLLLSLNGSADLNSLRERVISESSERVNSAKENLKLAELALKNEQESLLLRIKSAISAEVGFKDGDEILHISTGEVGRLCICVDGAITDILLVGGNLNSLGGRSIYKELLLSEWRLLK